MLSGEDSKTSERAVNLGLGAMSPLWPGFVLAAAAGVAYWGWTRWFRTDEPVSQAVDPDLSAPPAASEETPEAPIELAEPPSLEPVLAEAVVEASLPEPTVETDLAEPAPLVAEAVAPVVVGPPVAAAKKGAASKAPVKPKAARPKAAKPKASAPA